MKRWLLILAAAMWLSPLVANGDIEVKPQYDANEQIKVIVTATNVPEGAKLRGSFQVTDATWDLVSVPNALKLRAAASGLKGIMTSVPAEAQPAITAAVIEMENATAGETFHVWAGAGRHVITASGVWVMTKTVTVGAETFDVFVDFGQYTYTKEFVVGEGDDPVPPPPPPTPGQRWAVIWEETDQQRTPDQGNLFIQLRKQFPDSKLQILDVTNLPASLRALESQRPPNLPLPVLAIVVRQKDGTDKLLRTVPLPSSVAGVVEEMSK